MPVEVERLASHVPKVRVDGNCFADGDGWLGVCVGGARDCGLRQRFDAEALGGGGRGQCQVVELETVESGILAKAKAVEVGVAGSLAGGEQESNPDRLLSPGRKVDAFPAPLGIRAGVFPFAAASRAVLRLGKRLRWASVTIELLYILANRVHLGARRIVWSTRFN